MDASDHASLPNYKKHESNKSLCPMLALHKEVLRDVSAFDLPLAKRCGPLLDLQVNLPKVEIVLGQKLADLQPS